MEISMDGGRARLMFDEAGSGCVEMTLRPSIRDRSRLRVLLRRMVKAVKAEEFEVSVMPQEKIVDELEDDVLDRRQECREWKPSPA